MQPCGRKAPRSRQMSIVIEDLKKSVARRGRACRSARLPPDYPTQDFGTSRSLDSLPAGYFRNIAAGNVKALPYGPPLVRTTRVGGLFACRARGLPHVAAFAVFTLAGAAISMLVSSARLRASPSA